MIRFARVANLNGKAIAFQTPHRFLMERRMAHEREMLEQKSVTVAEAAYLTGFSSHAYMTTAFKRVLGLPPSEYRQK
jgi:AraC family transcriptional regulator